MPYRLTKIYTRTGDHGETTLGDRKLSKGASLVEAAGTVDELNAHLGMVITLNAQDASINTCLTTIQHDLFDLGGELHCPDHPAITIATVTRLEAALDGWNADLPPLTEFVLPGGNPPAAACHIARTVCRRAERCLVRLHSEAPLANPQLLAYLNRLSDLLFVIARVLARANHGKETLWQHSTNKETP